MITFDLIITIVHQPLVTKFLLEYILFISGLKELRGIFPAADSKKAE